MPAGWRAHKIGYLRIGANTTWHIDVEFMTVSAGLRGALLHLRHLGIKIAKAMAIDGAMRQILS
jgi:hypothetical protein